MAILGVHHCSFTVTDLDQTIRFYRDLLGMKLLGRKRRAAPDLGTALLGPDNAPGSENDASGEARDQAVRPAAGEILIADMELGGTRVEFIQYVNPPASPYHGDPSQAGSGHLAILTADIDTEYRRLQAAGVHFHSPVRTIAEPGKPVWRWCYFRDPDGICVELVESLPAPDQTAPLVEPSA